MDYDVQPETESVMKMIMDNPFVVSFNHLTLIAAIHGETDIIKNFSSKPDIFYVLTYIQDT